jgi:hypothetical protein
MNSSCPFSSEIKKIRTSNEEFEGASFHIGDSKDPFVYPWFAGGNTLVLFNMRVT